MQVNNSAYTSCWYQPDTRSLCIIDQTCLPYEFVILELTCLADVCEAITSMRVRGAPLIGVTAAFGLAFALAEDADDQHAQNAYQALLQTRPTAVNLRWAIDRVWHTVSALPPELRAQAALAEAGAIWQQDIDTCEKIGEHGLLILQQAVAEKPSSQPLNILTHCNAGWLATVDWGTALAPIYKAHRAGINLHVWVNETRPRNQGASLTAWELRQQGIPHTVIPDNAAGHIMQQGLVDLCIVGSDRTSARGDVCNKIGTYLKALAAFDNNIPFYAALPESTIDWTIQDGPREIPIEQRDAREVTHISGRDQQGRIREIQLIEGSPVANYSFDVTPAKRVSALITEHGVYQPGNLQALQTLLADTVN